MMDAGDGRNELQLDEPQFGGYLNYIAIFKSAFLPSLFFIIGFIIGRFL